jgi:6-phosphogluconate dehydrogenase
MSRFVQHHRSRSAPEEAGLSMIVAVMGVAGSGKSTVGAMLARAMGCPFLDADSLHSTANVAKMSRGIALTDDDRAPWLAAIHARLLDAARSGRSLVVACSALKQSYRNALAEGIAITWVYLKGSAELIRSRLQQRDGHYMKADLLACQFEALEEPSDAIIVDVSQSPEVIVEQVLGELRQRARGDGRPDEPTVSARRDGDPGGGTMQIGVIGLGRMGAGIAQRLLRGHHAVVGFDVTRAQVEQIVQTGAAGARSVEDLLGQLTPPRTVWVMVPHGAPTLTTIETLLPLLTPDDIVVDGGNSRYTDSMAHAARCREHGVHFLDVGVSGGVWGFTEGFNLMIGGPREAFSRLEPVFQTLAVPGGYAHVGPSGAGHFVKMIHNAIEYAMLQALGEGFECLERSEFQLDLAQIAGLWQHGAVVRSWLLDLLGRALHEEGATLEHIADYVDDSGTGRWAVDYALAQGIPVPAISIALYERFDSRLQKRFAHQVVAALRKQFGGHPVRED